MSCSRTHASSSAMHSNNAWILHNFITTVNIYDYIAPPIRTFIAMHDQYNKHHAVNVIIIIILWRSVYTSCPPTFLSNSHAHYSLLMLKSLYTALSIEVKYIMWNRQTSTRMPLHIKWTDSCWIGIMRLITISISHLAFCKHSQCI